MLDNERLICKMNFEQKIELVTSATLYESSSVGAYEFPVVRFCEKREKSETRLTQFPCERTLASTWNTELIEKVFFCAGEEARRHDVFEGYFSANDPRVQNISTSHYFTAQYLAARNRGALGKQPTAHRVIEASFEEELLRKNLTDTLLAESAPDVVIAESVENAELYLKNQEYTGLVYGVAATAEEAARFFFAGCAFVYLKEDFTKELVAYLDERAKNYRSAYAEYRANKLSLKELDRRARVLDIFDEGIIDIACDRVINFLKAKKKMEIKAPAEQNGAYTKAQRLQEEEHIRTARQAARESIVLLKNANRILPLQQRTKVALIGEYLEDFSYQQESFTGTPTRERLPIDVAKDFDEIDVVGYAAGYRRGESVSEELASNAARLASGADCAVVFLSAEPDKAELPENQVMLVKALTGWKVKVIAVISADRCVNTGFAKDCYAVLYTGRGGQESAAAVFDILTGAAAPSGKLTASAGSYPLGYGLSYGEFVYRDLEVSEGGITCLVENKGNNDGYATVQLYVQKSGSMYAEKTLKGFAKEFVKKGDVVRFTIPFTENTFRYYDAEKKKYRAQGGEYNLFVSDSAINDKLKGVIKIAADDGRTFTNTVEEKTTDGKVAFSESHGLKEKKGMPFGWKLFIAISLLIYFNAVMGLLLLAPFVPVDRTLIFYVITGVCTFVVDALLIVFLVLISVKRAKSYVPVNDVLSNMVDKVEDFVEIAKVTYPDPLKVKKEKAAKAQEEAKKEEEKKAEEKKQEEVKAQEQKEEKQEEERKSASNPSLDKPSDYPTAENLEKMCASFRRYFMASGINLGVSSARKILAGIAASRLVLISTKNHELLPEFMKTLNGYFGGLGISTAADNWNTMEDLLWRELAGRNMYSPFTNSIKDAYKRHNKNAVALIANVSSANLSDWFAEMIDFASSPSEEHKIKLNEDTSYVVPQNLCSLLFTQENGLQTELMREVVNASLQIEISIRKVETVDASESENAQPETAVSYPNFLQLVRSARENYYLSEKNWVKIDSLFETLNRSERVPFGNKNTLQAEKFTSVMMSCGEEENKTLECLFLAKIVPLLKTTRAYAQEDGVTAIYDLLQKTFPDEDLTKVQKALSERPKKLEEKVRNVFFTPGQRYEDVPESESGEGAENAESVEAPAAEPAFSEAPADTPTETPVTPEASAEDEVVFGGGDDIPAEEPVQTPAEEPAFTEEPVQTPVEEPTFTEAPASEQAFDGFEAQAGENFYNQTAEGAPAYDDGAAYGSYGDNGYGGYQDGQNGGYAGYGSYGDNGYGDYAGYGGYGGYQDGQNGGYDGYASGNWSDDNDGGQNK